MLLVVLSLLEDECQGQRLILACVADRWKEVEVLLQKPLAPDFILENYQTALHVAAVNGHGQSLGLLLEAGADKDAQLCKLCFFA